MGFDVWSVYYISVWVCLNVNFMWHNWDKNQMCVSCMIELTSYMSRAHLVWYAVPLVYTEAKEDESITMPHLRIIHNQIVGVNSVNAHGSSV